jgi:uncharacterized protein
MHPGTPLSATSERIVVVDVLRAFALFGIIVNHFAIAFLAGPQPKPNYIVFSALDGFVNEAVRLLTFGKFFAIFSFLFGLSFAIQLQSADRKGASFSGRFAWRLMILLLIGYVHGLFFSGDILLIYAVLGLLLIPVQNLKTRTLAVVALLLIFNVPGVVMGLATTSRPATIEQQQAARAGQAQFMQGVQRAYQIKKSGTVSELVQMNARETLSNKLRFQIFTGRLWITYGLFLLGICAGRMQLFRESEAHRALWRRVLLWSGSVALITTVIAALSGPVMRAQTTQEVWIVFSFSVQQASLAAFFVAAITLWFWKHPSGRLLPKLAPLGKMGLTTYLMQSVFGVLVFLGIGLGLMGELGTAACVGLGIMFFSAQIFIARWWLSHFKLGPIEWLWRSLTYFKIQPNSVSPARA